MAVHGLYPGIVSTRSIANLGHFEIEVIIEPVAPGGVGGGYGGSRKSEDYKITIRVTRKGKLWTQSYVVKKVVAKVFARILKRTNPFGVNVTSVNIQENDEVKVTVKRKNL